MSKACDVCAWLDWPAVVQVFDSETGESRDYLQERTCHVEFVTNVRIGNVALDCSGFRCSECGYESIGMFDGHYCPNCGAKVVD